MVELNDVHRSQVGGHQYISQEQMGALISDLNAARDHLRRAAAMLRLHGPAELADQADAVRRADVTLFRAVQTLGSTELADVPEAVTELAEALDAAVREFAVLPADTPRSRWLRLAT